MSDKIKKRYGNKPHLERDEESGKMSVKSEKKAADKEHEGDVEAGIKEEGFEKHELRHTKERRELKHKHIHEHMNMHNKHQTEHENAGSEEKSSMHIRQETELKDMHKQHASEFNQMHARHEKELAGKEKAGEIDKIKTDAKE